MKLLDFEREVERVASKLKVPLSEHKYFALWVKRMCFDELNRARQLFKESNRECLLESDGFEDRFMS